MLAQLFSILDSWTNESWRLAEPRWLMLLWALPVIALIQLLMAHRSMRAQRRIGDAEIIDTLLGSLRSWNTRLRIFVTALILGLLTIVVARPQSDPREIEVESRGRDVVFLLDISRSMLASDVAPNRLEKAKLWINDLVDQLGGDRVALVGFAGSSTIASPLTNDRLFFKLALEELSPDSVLVGGTNIGDAIRRTMELVIPEESDVYESGFVDLVLISDGEDQDSLPTEAARRAGSQGVRIIAIGIGSEKGAHVPSANSRDATGSPIQSRLESKSLRDIAAASPGGVYLEVGTGTIDLAQVYQDLIASADQRQMDTTTTTKYTERYMLFLSAGIILIVIDLTLIPTRIRRAPA